MSAETKFPELDRICKAVHVDSSQMSLNVHDQLFIARIFDMHYNSLLSEIGENIKELYDKQTSDLAEVILANHKDHLREIRKLTLGIRHVSKRIEDAEREIIKHEMQIDCIKKVIKELHGKNIEP